MYLDTIKTVARIILCYDCEISPTLPEEPGAFDAPDNRNLIDGNWLGNRAEG
jgi:hypothetical protein